MAGGRACATRSSRTTPAVSASGSASPAAAPPNSSAAAMAPAPAPSPGASPAARAQRAAQAQRGSAAARTSAARAQSTRCPGSADGAASPAASSARRPVVCARGGAGWLFPAVRACMRARARAALGGVVRGLSGLSAARGAGAPPPRLSGGGEGTLLVTVDPEGAQERAVRSEAELLQRPAARLAHRRPHETRVGPACGLRRARRGEAQSRRRPAGAVSAPRRAGMVPRRA
jgi:hypothetical protein